jgi:2-oxoglutarate dehydrogenase E1 component
MDTYSYLSNMTPESVEALYLQYQQNPDSVDFGWKKFFEGFEFSKTDFPKLPSSSAGAAVSGKELAVMNLIQGYRQRGHLFTRTNPVRERRKYTPSLSIENFGLSAADLSTKFQAATELGLPPSSLQDIVTHLESVYCNTIGIEYMYIRDPERIQWLRSKFENLQKEKSFDAGKKIKVLNRLHDAVGFEKFLHKKFVGQKRFSLEGGESLIPALSFAIERGAALGIEEFVLGMAHRGRINVLSNIFQKPAHQIFSEFQGYEYDEEKFDGDVKYHLGYNSRIQTQGGEDVALHLLPNPSHLETVGAIAEGLSRAFIDHFHDGNLQKVAPILIHGDAAVAAQGLVYEIIQMSKLAGYRTGGTLHLVINNQVGFTTNYLEGRSSTYCTDIAKVVLAPVFHVNADDAEAVVQVIELAMEYRQRYNEDVFIDLLGYRKHGHNEGDEPRFTQPILYKAIDKHPDPYQMYKKKLLGDGTIDTAACTLMEEQFNQKLDAELDIAKGIDKTHIKLFLDEMYGHFRRSTLADFDTSPSTGIPEQKVRELLDKLNHLPEDKKFLRKIVKIFQDRAAAVTSDKLDWALGEALAYASYLVEGKPVRLSGQDSVRGTFSHRHAIVRVEDSEEEYLPLNHLEEQQARFRVYNSLLSEYGVMGFDYGYAFGTPDGLTLWEAQFGDFNNGAQIIIDQYLSSAEDKWRTQNNLVLLLPHGYEGQGAEHSSARLERFLTLCAEMNMQVVNCTTPANFFHALRRQNARPFRKPLVVMTPKSLLRHPECVSTVADFSGNTRFQELIDDASVKATDVETVVFCSGKIYYELLALKRDTGDQTTALVRLEQLFPFPVKAFEAMLEKYSAAKRWLWVQEEPENMGAWSFILRAYRKGKQNFPLEVVAPPASASPASGSSRIAAARQKAILERVFSKVPLS